MIKKIFKNSIIIFLLTSICHFIYDIFPTTLTSFLFPVNESVWEHLKLIFTSCFIFTFIHDYKNKPLNAFLRSILTIVILLSLYLPITYFINENLIITLIILFISIIFSELIISIIPKEKDFKVLNIISTFLLIASFLIFIYFTYYPLKNNLFLDKIHNQYGIIK